MNNDEIMEKEGIANQYKLKVRRALDEARIDERNKKYSLQDSIDYAKEIDKRVADEHNKAFKEGYDKGKREGQDKTGKSDTMKCENCGHSIDCYEVTKNGKPNGVNYTHAKSSGYSNICIAKGRLIVKGMGKGFCGCERPEA